MVSGDCGVHNECADTTVACQLASYLSASAASGICSAKLANIASSELNHIQVRSQRTKEAHMAG